MADFLDWADRLIVDVRGIEHLDAEASTVWRLEVDESPFERDEPARAVHEAAENERLGERGNELAVRRTYLSWGADASMHQVLRTVGDWAGSGLVGAAVLAALRHVRDRVSELRVDAQTGEWAVELSDGDWLYRATLGEEASMALLLKIERSRLSR